MCASRNPPPTRCTAVCKNGRPCGAWAERGSDPPRCRSHREQAPTQEPPQPRARAAQRASDLDGMIAGLQHRLNQLSTYIDRHLPDLDHSTYARLSSLHGQLAGRASRLLLDRKQLVGDAGNELIEATHAALDRLSDEWGIEL